MKIRDIIVLEANWKVCYVVVLDKHKSIDKVSYICKNKQILGISTSYKDGTFKEVLKMTMFYKVLYAKVMLSNKLKVLVNKYY